MIEAPQVVRAPAVDTAFVHVTVARSAIKTVMGPAIREVYAALKAQGVAPMGPWFTHHHQITPDEFDFDACVPVMKPVTPIGRVRPGRREEARVARALYRGAYEGLADAWGALKSWASEENLAARGDLWEVYLVGPESAADSAEFRTELVLALRS